MLSQTSRHVLRALAWIAASSADGVAAEDIARHADVPRRYLSKILRRLTRAGVLVARRGVKGGYRLARPAKDITLADLVAPFEDAVTGPECVLGGGRLCSNVHRCPVHMTWGGIRDSMDRFLGRTTLAEIASPIAKRRRRRRS
ncbi:MAG: Rrf2 family transcriptional regulator [Planctomycetes bacterium]|nr:Rrf2 family transcriptional regulator [Planctomycetota bacterium]